MCETGKWCWYVTSYKSSPAKIRFLASLGSSNTSLALLLCTCFRMTHRAFVATLAYLLTYFPALPEYQRVHLLSRTEDYCIFLHLQHKVCYLTCYLLYRRTYTLHHPAAFCAISTMQTSKSLSSGLSPVRIHPKIHSDDLRNRKTWVNS